MLWVRAILILAIGTSVLYPIEPRKSKNVILVTADGLRWQDLFGGMDPLLMNEKAAGMEKADELRNALWRPSSDERRAVLMPFFWNILARKGLVLGNVRKGSSVEVSNSFRVSFPGYSEILTGRARDQLIHGNDPIRNPTPTLLEFLREKLELRREQVALFGSWELFDLIGENRPGSILINAGYHNLEFPEISPRLRELNAIQFQILTPWPSVRHDYVTFQMALEYMRTIHPRVMHVALGETDDWAHDKRYDRVLEAIRYFDRCLQDLWQEAESIPEYRGTTSIIITCDHGRGSTLADWHSHGARIMGSEHIWIAVAGPDTPARGEVSNAPRVFQRDIAPTILALLGLDYRDYDGVEGRPIEIALPDGRFRQQTK